MNTELGLRQALFSRSSGHRETDTGCYRVARRRRSNVTQAEMTDQTTPSISDPLGCLDCTHPECGRFEGPRSWECRAMKDNACARQTTPEKPMPRMARDDRSRV